MDGDFELLEAWSRGDRKAGDRLFSRHFDSLYRFFHRKVEGEVDDLLQRTFLACVEGRERFRKQASFRTFLFAVARRQLYKYWRDRKPQADITLSCLCDLSPTPSQIIAGNEQQRLLLRALRQIALELQIAVELYYWEDMTGPELAAVLGIAEGTVRSRLRRAREALVQAIEALESNPETLRTTVDNLERWARSLRQKVPRET